MHEKVFCILHPRDQGADQPDGGLFTYDQLAGDVDDTTIFSNAKPARGVVEVKPTTALLAGWIDKPQVAKYRNLYGVVLVTNYWQFAVVGRDGSLLMEPFQIAETESAFWEMTRRPRAAAKEREDAVLEYLGRALLNPAPIVEPEDVARGLAAYAREAKGRIGEGDLEQLSTIREALEQALDIEFDGEEGDSFFRSSFTQTLFYGVFSAWVLWARQDAENRERFAWTASAQYLKVPIIRKLFHEVADPGPLDELGVTETLAWTEKLLARVDIVEFFARFQEDEAIQYFYEPFLAAFDPVLRVKLGVWYTPREIIRYQVARIDTVLREELGIDEGLAADNVVVLDPCCGTGAYLVEVLRTIERTFVESGYGAMVGARIKEAASSRIVGFELLPAPFIVAHLQLGLMMQALGVPFAENGEERASIYLTNALTGWEQNDAVNQRLLFPELEAERDAAAFVKSRALVLVVVGNPPYSGFAGVAIDEERELSEAYRETRQAPPPVGQGRNDLFVRFFRVAERKIVDGTGEGIVCFITNSSWLDSRSLPGMRERFADEFDQVWVDNLNGDAFRTGKRTPDGDPDPSIFSTASNPEGIAVGTAISLMVRTQHHNAPATVLYRDMWGQEKREDLLATASQADTDLYEELQPSSALGLPFRPAAISVDYATWAPLDSLFPTGFPGIKTSRDDLVVAIDRESLINKINVYFDSNVSDEEIGRDFPSTMRSTATFNGPEVREYLVHRGFLPDQIRRYVYRPFDLRWLYWEPETGLLDRKRADYIPQVGPGNVFIATRESARKGWSQPQVIQSAGSLHLTESGTTCIPLVLAEPQTADLFTGGTDDLTASDGRRYNLSPAAAAYLRRVGAIDEPSTLFFHAIAITSSPLYGDEHADALGLTWARIPLPAAGIQLKASAYLGRGVAQLLDVESDVDGVTRGRLGRGLSEVGTISTIDGRNIDLAAGDLDVTARWGLVDAQRAVMPGPGRITEREFQPSEKAALEQWLGGDYVGQLFGGRTIDVWLNESVYWRNIPEGVWEFALGGYPVLKKWLSYRAFDVIHRGISIQEANSFSQIVRRIASIVRMTPSLDANYAASRLETVALE